MKLVIKIMFTFALFLCFSMLSTNTLFAEENSDQDDLILQHKERIHQEAYPTLSNAAFDELYNYYTEAYGVQLAPVSLSTRDSLADIKTGYWDYFQSAYWLTRDDGITLSLYYTTYLFEGNGNNPNVLMYKAGLAFDALYNHWRSNSNWNNTDSMSAQFHCHVTTIGQLKKPWNIEPWRTESNLALVIAAGCNP